MQYDHLIRVHARDTDYGGVMYHPNYIDFFEKARVEWLNHLGVDLAALAHQKIFFPVASVQVDYLIPVFFNDQVLIKSELLKCGKVSLLFSQHMFNQQEQLVSKAIVKVGCVNHTRKPYPIPNDIRGKFIHA